MSGDDLTIVNIGGFCFRWRSYLPLALVPAVLAAIAWTQFRFAFHTADLAWEAGCVFVALVGCGLRVWTVGSAAPGTSGRNTREQKAVTLNTTGPYSLIRHPLYVGNGFIAVGFSLFPHAWVLPPLVIAATFSFYACIVRHEEAFLRGRFGPAFDRWAARVPAWVPTLRTYVPSERAFEWRVPLRREFYAAAWILTLPLAFDTSEHWLRDGAPALDPVWAPVAVLGAAFFTVFRSFKKRTQRWRRV